MVMDGRVEPNRRSGLFNLTGLIIRTWKGRLASVEVMRRDEKYGTNGKYACVSGGLRRGIERCSEVCVLLFLFFVFVFGCVWGCRWSFARLRLSYVRDK